MKRYFIVSDIEWDTEEALPEDIEQIEQLPETIGYIASSDVVREWEDDEYEEEDIMDYIEEYLVEEYEWCMSNYSIEEVSKEEYKKKLNA